MRCPLDDRETRNLLLEFVCRRLEVGIAAELRRHVDACAACRAFTEAQAAVEDALDAWAAPPVSAGFNQQHQARIERERAGWWTRLAARLAPAPRPVWPLAGACAVVVIALLLQPGKVADVPSGMRADFVEAEQVETTLEDVEMLRQLDQVSGAEAAQPM